MARQLSKNYNVEIIQFSIAPLEKLTDVQSANILMKPEH